MTHQSGTRVLGLKSDSTGYSPIKLDASGLLKVADTDVSTALTALVGYADELESKLETLNTSTIANLPFNPNTPSTWTNSRLGTILTQQIDGTHITKNKITRTDGTLMTAQSLAILELYTTNIDCSAHTSLRLIGIATEPFNIYGSIDDVNYYLIDTIYPSANLNHLNHFNYKFEHPPKYIKIKNGSSTNTATIHYDLTH